MPERFFFLQNIKFDYELVMSGEMQIDNRMETIRFDAGEMSFILCCANGEPPSILYWGPRLAPDISLEQIRLLSTRQSAHGIEDVNIQPSLAMEPGIGYTGPTGFSAHREGQDWGSRFVVQNVKQDLQSCQISCHDHRTDIALDYDIVVDSDNGSLTFSSSITNQQDRPLDLVDMATICLPIPAHITDIIGFSGRWAREFQMERISRFSGSYMRENRRGRTSHDCFPALILCEDNSDEQSGEAYGFHLAWSGNSRLRVDSNGDGRIFASMGALLFPGEIRLKPGESYHSPQLVAAYSGSGLSSLSQQFHDHVRTKLLRQSTRSRGRPVHYNSWEAVYFDHDPDRLKALATRAADVGVERFVLDDGWFGARRNDAAGLGDWHVSDTVYPDGLKPLIDHVTGLGMEMGIWFEPEMINADSDLYRAHPDWILGLDGVEQVPFRNQYVLDISRSEVSDHLFERVSAILSDHDIGYVKWDMNRDLNHPGNDQGVARAYMHVQALWALIDRLRSAHPDVEFESCASGGGRTDYGMLARTDRVWTSDSNDALDRQTIQRGASHFLPLKVMGAHVGPRHCHITGRTLSMAMRAGTALMGHMGLELNLLDEPAEELEELKAAIVLYKDHRNLLHDGDFSRVDSPEYLNIMGVVAKDQREALYSVAYLTGQVPALPGRFRFAGLDPKANYRIRQIWPEDWSSEKSPSIVEVLDLGTAGQVVSGELLTKVGMQLPVAPSETVLLFHLSAE